MIKEDVVDISTQEEKSLKGFLKNLEIKLNHYTKAHSKIDNGEILEFLNDTAYNTKTKFGIDNIHWKFYRMEDETKAGYDSKNKVVSINLWYAVPEPDKKWLRDQQIDWKAILSWVLHEWVRVKQDVLVRQRHRKGMAGFEKMYNRTEYHNVKWEQMALAREEIEWIKNNAKRISPNTVIKWLQKWGIIGNQNVTNLKQTNPKAYKRILKYAVMFMLKKMAQKATQSSS